MEDKQPAAVANFRSYLTGLLGGGLLTLAALGAGFGALAWSDRLAAPPISKIEHLDEKLRFLRRNPEIDPSLIVIGSSMAWRQFDAEPFAAKLGQGHVLNGATAFLKIHQTRFLTSFYMDSFPRLRTIVLMLGPTDFQNCTSIPADLFDPDEVRGYVFEQDSPAPLYLRYFSPAHYLRRARDYEERLVPMRGDLFMDSYGSGPMQWTPEMMKGLRYGDQDFDRACIHELHKLLSEIKSRNIRPVVVFSPLHPEFRQRYSETIQQLKQIAAQVKAEIQASDFFDMTENNAEAADFFDAIHLQWTAARVFSRQLVSLVLPGQIADGAVPAPINQTTNHVVP
jgi:hypothetical protein